MRVTDSVAVTGRYVLTDAGRRALQEPILCSCVLRVERCWVICSACGTCYANLSEMGGRAWQQMFASTKTARS